MLISSGSKRTYDVNMKHEFGTCETAQIAPEPREELPNGFPGLPKAGVLPKLGVAPKAGPAPKPPGDEPDPKTGGPPKPPGELWNAPPPKPVCPTDCPPPLNGPEV